MRKRFFHSPSGGDLNGERRDSDEARGALFLFMSELRKLRVSAIESLKMYFRLLRYVRQYLYLLIFVLILSIITSLISILPPQIMGVAINEIIASGKSGSAGSIQRTTPRDADSGTTQSIRRSLPITPVIRKASDYAAKRMPGRNPFILTFYVLTAAYLLLYLVNTGISVIRGFVMAKLGQSIVFDMRNHIYGHLQKLSLRYFGDHRTGDIMSRVINDIASLQSMMVGPVIGFITDVIKLGWILYFILRWDWRLTMLSLLVGPVMVPATVVFGIYMRETFRLIRRKMGELNALLQDNLSGIRIIKGFAREEYEFDRFKEKGDENRRLRIRVARIMAVFSPSMNILMQAGSMIVLSYGGVKVIRGQMDPGMFIVLFPYIRMVYGPIGSLSRFYSTIQQALASVERVFEVLDTEPDIAEKKDAVELPVIRGEVEFRNVNFSYSDGVEVLKNVSLKAYPGQMVAFVGPSGAGKTTSVNLVPRFYDPTEGDVFIDGHNIRDVKLNSLRKQMGIVLQEPFLFNDTVKTSIAYGKLDATDEEIVEAANAANAHDFIQELPQGYDTVIGERGTKLSGGQRQRISIARAILANPRILILDEATSSVDTETEMLIQDAIQRLVKDRTTFVIAHRLSTIHDADLIVVLDKGNVVGMGSHDELLTKGGLYSRLHKVQFRTPNSEKKPPTDRAPLSEDDEKLDQKIDDEFNKVDDWPESSDS